jgi:ABC-type antimicrobial peptide transport system permease subunit
MNETQVKVYYSLYGDDFPINEVTRRLEITPTESYKKGNLISANSSFYRKETSWDYGTGYQYSLDVNEQLQQVMNPLRDKCSIINELQAEFGLGSIIYIVIRMVNGQAPALYLEKDILTFASSIGAEIEVDFV